MKNFRTYELAMEFYEKCECIEIKNPVIKDQFRRASLSIVLNLAEGSGRITFKDRRKFYSIAMGSLRETQCLLMVMKQHKIFFESDHLAACLYKLINNPGSL